MVQQHTMVIGELYSAPKVEVQLICKILLTKEHA